jgi:hypothetical protein
MIRALAIVGTVIDIIIAKEVVYIEYTGEYR